jgi:hypothetical protein
MDCTGLKPDICVYPKDDLPDGGKTDFSKIDFFTEFKIPTDPFVADGRRAMAEENSPFEKNSEESQLIRGQLASYAAAVAGTQSRVHTFCVIVCGKFVRFIRWDRGGAIVTEPFDCAENPQFLAEFFWRFNFLTAEQKGRDTSVSPVPEHFRQDILKTLRKEISAAEHAEHAEHAEPSKTSKTSAREQTPVSPPTPLPEDPKEFRIFKVPDRENPGEEKDFVVWLHGPSKKYTARSLFGRGTRPMLA